jgi:hypothetical protein
MVVSWTRWLIFMFFVACLVTAVIVQHTPQRAVALAAATVLLATFYLYKPKPPPRAFERLPPEDFTVWVDSGELFSRIESMGADLKSAATIARQDLDDLNQNLELLIKRLEIMEGKGVRLGELKDMVSETVERVKVLSKEFPEFPGRALEKRDFLLNTLEQCSINLQHVSEKLMEISRNNPPEISTPLVLLQTRSNKIAEDFRKAKSHLISLLDKIKPPTETVSPVITLPELKPVEVKPPEKPPESPQLEKKPEGHPLSEQAPSQFQPSSG